MVAVVDSSLHGNFACIAREWMERGKRYDEKVERERERQRQAKYDPN